MEVNSANVEEHKCDFKPSTRLTMKESQINLEQNRDNSTSPSSKPLLLPMGVAPISKIFIDDLTERKRLWRIPWFIAIMSCVQISFYFIANECIYQRFMFMPEQSNNYWRYYTYTLLHSDTIHLLLNVFLQCMIGFCLECEQGHWKVSIIYIASGIFGPLATSYVQPDLSLLGASASVYGLFASHVPHMMKNYSQLTHRFLRFVALLTLCVSDIGFTAFHYLINHNVNPRICVEAHIAGGVAGLCFGFLLYSRDKGRGYMDNRILRI